MFLRWGDPAETMERSEDEGVTERDALWYADLLLRLCQIAYYVALIVVLRA
jgi:hypothetical protein